MCMKSKWVQEGMRFMKEANNHIERLAASAIGHALYLIVVQYKWESSQQNVFSFIRNILYISV